LGGDLSITSKSGKGSVVSFTFRCNAAVSSPSEKNEGSHRRLVEKVSNNRLIKVLVVDDVKHNRDILRLMLAAIGFVVEEACDGVEAVSIAREWLPDIILMDRRMPEMDGLDATLAIKAMPETKNIPVIVVSASALEENRQEALATCADGFVRKPFREEEMTEEIQRLLPEIVYIYKDKEQEICERTTKTDLSDVVGDLPASTLVELRGSIEGGDIFRFDEILEKCIKEHDPQLAVYLRQLADQYDYDGILELLSRGEVHE
jgi:CheY-like chemotaxis protein